MQSFEPQFGVFFFVLSGLTENIRDLFVSFLVCFGSVKGVFITRLAFACECRHQIGLSATALKVHFEPSFDDVREVCANKNGFMQTEKLLKQCNFFEIAVEI